MKIFANIFEMIDYMSICPACLGKRKVDVSVGPDYVFNRPSIDFSCGESICSDKIDRIYSSVYPSLSVKKNNVAELKIQYANGYGSIRELSINIDSNNYFSINCGTIPSDENIFMWVESQCINCDIRTYSASSDIEFCTSSLRISNLELEMNSVYIDNFSVEFNYISDTVRILLLKKGIVSFPIWNEDFRDKDKLLKRIKTILTFG